MDRKIHFPQFHHSVDEADQHSVEGIFVVEDWHNFGADYDKTLISWFKNFDKHWPEISIKYSLQFDRMWKFYLLSCAGTFRARNMQLWQIVLSKRGMPGGYKVR